jgi:glycine cleavage system aminomethyltransferase T
VSVAFLSPRSEAIARSPMEREALAAGARLERRDGWNVGVAFDGPERERKICRDAVGFADRSAVGKIEVQASAVELAAIVAATARGAPAGRGERLELGRAVRAEGAWWCPYTPERALVLCEPAATAALRGRLEEAAAAVRGLAGVVDVTTAHGALARELFARFTAIDLRPHVTPVHGFRPGSLARVPGAILREAEERYLMLFGAALGRYVWTVVSDAAQRLGGAPVGVDALASVEEEAVSHA